MLLSGPRPPECKKIVSIECSIVNLLLLVIAISACKHLIVSQTGGVNSLDEPSKISA